MNFEERKRNHNKNKSLSIVLWWQLILCLLNPQLLKQCSKYYRKHSGDNFHDIDFTTKVCMKKKSYFQQIDPFNLSVVGDADENMRIKYWGWENKRMKNLGWTIRQCNIFFLIQTLWLRFKVLILQRQHSHIPLYVCWLCYVPISIFLSFTPVLSINTNASRTLKFLRFCTQNTRETFKSASLCEP